jgi:hypothetical protein
MKKITALLLLLTVAAFLALAQTNTTSTTPEPPPLPLPLPQWVRDVRRFEIILFGSFPFSMFTVTTVTDLVRWNQNSVGFLDFNDAGLRYAPWPLKAARAVPMTNEEQIRTITFAVGVSAAIALADLIIVLVKRNKERRRVESLPVGTVIINRTPLPEEPSAQEPLDQDPAAQAPLEQPEP